VVKVSSRCIVNFVLVTSHLNHFKWPQLMAVCSFGKPHQACLAHEKRFQKGGDDKYKKAKGGKKGDTGQHLF